MKTIRYKSRGNAVFLLEEILHKLGYEIKFINTYFDLQTHQAVMDFQAKHGLVVDGIVGTKTWTVLIREEQAILDQSDKYLSEEDLEEFSTNYGLELAVVKAVNEVESTGRGFLIDGRPKILFEGHKFWKGLRERGINPNNYVNEHTKNVLYAKWTRKHYKGGSAEYHRLDKASGIDDDPAFRAAALGAASWGAFQIMGYHAEDLGYPNVEYFVADMYEHEREHLKAFGRYLETNNLIRFLKSKDWTRFARGYNGSGYATNRYDTRMEQAYNRYIKLMV